MGREYIEREAALEKVIEVKHHDPELSGVVLHRYIKEIDLKDIPAADVVEVVHAKWDDNGRCTNCGGHAPYYSMASTYYASPYCFECGAKMDKEAADDKEQPEEAPGE